MMKRRELVELRDEIKASAAQGREVRARIHATRDRERYDAWNEKRRVGTGARELMLACAFLRGVPYRVVEPTCGESLESQRYDAVQRKWITEVGWWFRKQILVIAQRFDPSRTEAEILAWAQAPEDPARRALREGVSRFAREQQLRRSAARSEAYLDEQAMIRRAAADREGAT
jgi:hypothetical protein